MSEFNEKKLKTVAEEMAQKMSSIFSAPDWKPLEKVVPNKWLNGFMFYGKYTKGEYDTRDELNRPIRLEINDYKHGITRRTIHISPEGKCYCNTDTYNKIEDKIVLKECSCTKALDFIYKDIDKLGATRETAYDEEYQAAKCKALAEAGFTVIGIKPGEIDITTKEIRMKEKIKKKKEG